jgi:hypothetical protein
MRLIGIIISIQFSEKGAYTMQRLHHLSYTAQRGGEQIREDEPQAIPIYDAIT